jgi:hypothetical protein
VSGKALWRKYEVAENWELRGQQGSTVAGTGRRHREI